MKSKHLTTLGFVLVTTIVLGQNLPDQLQRYQTNIDLPDAIERYKIDYELKDYTFINNDSTILLQLDLESLEAFRSLETDIEVEDSNTGLVVLLYHKKKNEVELNSISHEE